MTTLEHLQAAARLLIEKGWCQGTYLNGAGQHCLLGAVNAVRPRSFGTPTLVADALWVANLHVMLPSWNDTPGRTKDEVLELFNYAIAIEAGKVAA